VHTVLAESVSGGETTDLQDAQADLRMLTRLGIGWSQLHRAYGDRAWQAKSSRRWATKSNAQHMAALETALQIRAMGDRGGLSPRLQTVKRGKGGGPGSVHFGNLYLHQLMVRDRFRVHRSCEHTVEALLSWTGKDDKHKHHIDRIRYALDDRIQRFRASRPAPGVRFN